jgi:hypothetical protein
MGYRKVGMRTSSAENLDKDIFLLCDMAPDTRNGAPK